MRLALVALLLAGCLSQTARPENFIVDLTGLSKSDTVTILTDATVLSAPASHLLRLTAEPRPPVDPDDPDDPTPSDPLKVKVKKWATAVNDPVSAQKLALAYRTVADQIKSGTLKDKSVVVEAQRRINDQLVAGASGSWDGFFSAVSGELTALQAAGQLNGVKEVEVAWREIASGLDEAASAANVQPLTPDQWQQIIQLVIQLILMLIGGGAQ